MASSRVPPKVPPKPENLERRTTADLHSPSPIRPPALSRVDSSRLLLTPTASRSQTSLNASSQARETLPHSVSRSGLVVTISQSASISDPSRTLGALESHGPGPPQSLLEVGIPGSDDADTASDAVRSLPSFKTAVLYKFTCMQRNTQQGLVRVNRYASEPFRGMDRQKERESVSVMDVLDGAYGMFDTLPNQQRRRNQTRELFATEAFEDDEEPFKLDSDFIITNSLPRSIRIMSKAVISFIKQSLPYYPEVLDEEELIIGEPFEPLTYTYGHLSAETERLAATTTSKEMGQHPSGEPIAPNSPAWEFKVVRDWFKDNYYDKEIAPERSAHAEGFATFSKLWLLYQPGTYVFMGEGIDTEFYIVKSISHPTYITSSNEIMVNPKRWSITIWSLGFRNGRLARRERSTPVEIHEFSGRKEVARFPIIPLRYIEGMKDGRSSQRYIDRGKLHRQFLCEAPALKQYAGALGGRKELQYSGAAIVDPLVCAEQASSNQSLGTTVKYIAKKESFGFTEPQDNDGGTKYGGLGDILPSETGPFETEEELYLLFPGKIYGFALGNNQWAQFDIESFLPPNKSTEGENPFENLVMKQEELDLIRAIAETENTPSKLRTHIKSAESDVLEPFNHQQTDFVQGKGLGKVILLHGPPGVGKSFTVECLAQQMNRPLLSLAATDVGTDQSTERKLSRWLDLAQRWHAIVLLDEADTILERRKEHDMERNAMVAEYLHALEYYPGLIFLTSNLPAWLDDAFISRFHLCIEYPELEQTSRDEIWRKFVEKSRKEERLRHKNKESDEDIEHVNETLDKVLDYVIRDPKVKTLKLNGRDIRNAYQAAARIAMHRTRNDRSPMFVPERKDVEMVIENKKGFQRYLERAFGENEQLRAYSRFARAAPQGIDPSLRGRRASYGG